MIARRQLVELGFTGRAIDHKLAKGRLHPVRRGVYAVGRPGLTRYGRWMAAVLACGPQAVLSHESAAALWSIRDGESSEIEVSVLAASPRRPAGIGVHRRTRLARTDLCLKEGIPLTCPVRTLIDLAPRLRTDRLEAAINDADRLELIDPESVRRSLDGLGGEAGVALLRSVLDRRTFTLTHSELARRFVPIARQAGLGPPLTQQFVNGFRVDFFWPELGLVVETDGLRYHRTPSQQARDRLRDQAHTAAGLAHLRFTHAQVRYEPGHVHKTLATVARRLAPGKPS